MKTTLFVTIGVLMAALASAAVFADDAQMQMNGGQGQMGQAQPAAPVEPAMPMPTNAQNTNQPPQTGTLPAAPTGNADTMNMPAPASSNN